MSLNAGIWLVSNIECAISLVHLLIYMRFYFIFRGADIAVGSAQRFGGES